jgi:hypothetical protein
VFHSVSNVPATQSCSTGVFDVAIKFERRFARYGQIGHAIFDLEYPCSCLRVESRIDRSPNDWLKESFLPGQSRIIARLPATKKSEAEEKA